MNYVYILLNQKDYEWEDIVIFDSEEEAIKASIKYPKLRVEIFSKKDNFGFTPTYNYYKQGELILNNQ